MDRSARVRLFRRVEDRSTSALFLACAAISVLTTAGIVGVLAVEAAGFFREGSLSSFLFDTQWTPLFEEKHFGIAPLLAGTLLTTVIAVALAIPLGLLAAIYLSEFASVRVRKTVKPVLEML